MFPWTLSRSILNVVLPGLIVVLPLAYARRPTGESAPVAIAANPTYTDSLAAGGTSEVLVLMFIAAVILGKFIENVSDHIISSSQNRNDDSIEAFYQYLALNPDRFRLAIEHIESSRDQIKFFMSFGFAIGLSSLVLGGVLLIGYRVPDSFYRTELTAVAIVLLAVTAARLIVFRMAPQMCEQLLADTKKIVEVCEDKDQLNK